MTRSLQRTISKTVALCTATLLTLGALSTIPSARADEEQTTNALSEFGACLHGEHKGTLLLLVDQSGSLRKTDGDNNRLLAGEFLIERFGQFADTSKVELEIKIAGFAANYNGHNTWTKISGNTQNDVKESLRQIVKDIHDYDTDYWTALNNARSDIDERAKTLGTSCKAIAWFTDGEFDIDVRDSDEALEAYGAQKPYAQGIDLADPNKVKDVIARGKSDICRPKGVADQMRASKIGIITIGLTQSNPDFSFVKQVLMGGGKNAQTFKVDQCGDFETTPGLFLEAKDLDSLYSAFDTMSTPGQTTQQRQAQVCQGKICNDAPLNFVLDDTLNHVRVLVTSDIAGVDAHLFGPGNQQPLDILAGKSGAESGTLPFKWLTEKTLEFTLDREKIKEWAGEWRLVLVDKKSSDKSAKFTANLHLTSFVQMDVSAIAKAKINKGETYKDLKVFAFDTKTKETIALEKLKGNVSVKVTLTDAKKVEHVLVEGGRDSLKNSLTLDTSDLAIGNAQLRSTLKLTTAPVTLPDGKQIEGTALAPTESTAEITIQPPLKFPTVDGALDFGTLDGEVTATTDLTVSGEGCVWISGEQAELSAAPATIEKVTVTSEASTQDSCIKVEGAQTTIPVKISFNEADNGALVGDIEVSLASSDGTETSDVTIPFRAEVQKPLNVAAAWGTFVIALLLGIGLPIVMLYLFKYLGSVIPRGNIGVLTMPLEIPEGDVQMPVTITLPQEGRQIVNVPKGARTLNIGAYTLNVRTGASPVSTGWVEFVGSAPSVSGDSPGHKDGHATMPLGVRGQWVAVLDQPNSPQRITLILLAASSDQHTYEAIAKGAEKNLRSRLKSLTQDIQTRGESAKTGSDGFGAAIIPSSSEGGDLTSPVSAPSQPLTPPTASPAPGSLTPPVTSPMNGFGAVPPAPPLPGMTPQSPVPPAPLPQQPMVPPVTPPPGGSFAPPPTGLTPPTGSGMSDHPMPPPLG